MSAEIETSDEFVYGFFNAHGKMVASTTSEKEAAGWKPHRKPGETIVRYKRDKEIK
jgi:hypothetical protein